jgi:hypothetical protein
VGKRGVGGGNGDGGGDGGVGAGVGAQVRWGMGLPIESFAGHDSGTHSRSMFPLTIREVLTDVIGEAEAVASATALLRFVQLWMHIEWP